MITMKLKQIALAVGAALAAPVAFAAYPVDISAGVPASNIVYISGASAQTATLGGVVAAQCNVAPVTWKDDKDGKQDFIYKCTDAKATSGYGAGSTFIVVKRDTNGSYDGVGPVINKTNLDWADLTLCNDATLRCAVSTGVNGGSSISRAPHAGLSDVEIAVWKGRGQFNATTTAYTETTGFAGQAFGIVVSEALYNAMQTYQKSTGELPSSCVVGDYATGSCQPNITKAQYASIVSQTGGYHTDWAPIVGAAGTGKAVNLCRRVPTSGTQASSDIFFLNSPCANTATNAGALAVATALDSSSSFIVTEGSGTGDVRTCLQTANTAGNFAIGVISMENPVLAGFKYVKLNGVSPNFNVDGTADLKQRQNAIDGKYEFAFEPTTIWRNDLDAAHKTFMGRVIAFLSDPALTNLTGFWQIPGTYDNATYPTQVAKGTRSANGGANSCQNVQLF
jgi:hypothetical protein